MWILRTLCRLALLIGLLALSVAPADAASAGVSLVSTFQPGGSAQAAAVSAKWDRVLSRVTEGDACPASNKACSEWQALKSQLTGTRDLMVLISRVNQAMNRPTYVEDRELWSRSDYWATPVEFLGRRAGDCEDYAIAKYLLLRELGVPEKAMRIAIVRDVRRNLVHAVLVVQTDTRLVMLDNVIEQVVPAGSVPQYRALVALNHSSMSTYLGTAGASAAGG